MLRNFEHVHLIRFCTSSVYWSIFKKWVCNIFLRSVWNYFMRYHTSTIFIKCYFDLAANIKRKRERQGQGDYEKDVDGKVSVMYNSLAYSLSLFEVQLMYNQFSSVQSFSLVWLPATPRTEAHQASQSITISRSLLKLMSIELVMPSNHLILYHPLLLRPSIFPSIRVFSNESVLRIRWSKYWSFSFSISPSNEYSGLSYFTKKLTGICTLCCCCCC